MIQHRPLGSGHPYAVDTEQRWPDPPLVGQALHLGVRTSGDIERVMVEVETSAGPSQTELTPVVRSSRGQSQDGGHLASAQAKQARRQGGWQTELTVVEAGPIRYRFTALSADGRQQRTKWYSCRAASWRPAPDSALAVDGSSQRLIPGTVEILDDGQRRHRLRFALALDPMEHVSGFGERYDRLDQRGVALDSQVFEQYKSQGLHRRTYLPMPFAHVVGAQGWGFHVRSSRRVWFDLTQPDRIVIEAIIDPKATPQTQIDRDGRLAGANDPGATRRDSSDPSTATAARFDQSTSSDEAPLTLAVYQGSPDQVLAAFLAEVGRPRELPSWVFRLWASGNEWNTQAEVERQVELHRRHDIPVGNVVVEAWSDESTFTIFRDAQYRVRGDGGPLRLADFSFPPDGAWPDPKAMTDRLHAAGIRLHLWQIPLLKMRPHPSGQLKADAAAALRQDLLIQETAPDGSLRPYRNRGWWFPLALMPDLTDQRAAGWWTDKRRYLVEEIGIDGFKTDGGEHAWGSDLVYLDGRRGDEANNQFPVAYAAAYGRLLESCGKAPVTFSRAGFTGSQAHGAFWAGDENSTWEAFRWSMIAGLNAAACGIVYWGWDIAGFSGPIPDAELYLRAMAASTFVPIMQYHSEFNHHRQPSRDRTPWNIADQTGDRSVIDEVRQLVQLRERLIPYLADQAHTTIATARPLMRPLYFDHPRDPLVWEHPIQWSLGDDLLVAPVLEAGRTSWPVYLPDGQWVNVWTGEAVQSGLLEVEAPRPRIPVFARQSAWAELEAVFEG